MAFQMGSPSPFGGSTGGTSNAQTQTGPDLEEIQTEALGFQAIAGEAKLRLLPTPWPADALPPPTASLLSIASKKGLLAAAGPESVVIAGTDSVRQAFSSSGDGNIKPYTPQLTLPIGMRVSQVAFSADEEFLVLSAETGGGLAVYEVQALMQGKTESAFQLPTDGAALRALVPNPTPDKAELFAAVTTNGQLLMANLKTRQFLKSSQGQVLKDGVSCVSWSTRGKQLVVGLGNGTVSQMTPEGVLKAELPRPPALEGDQHVSAISWLENNVFLVAHTPSAFEADQAPTTTYHVVTRHAQTPSAMMFQKLPDPCPPFGMNRSPPFQFMQRLKEFPPNLSDAIIIASTASADIGLFTRSMTPLSNDVPAEQVSNVFTTTTMADDSRRAQLPMSEGLEDTSPIGIGFDLSSKDRVLRPLPKEEYEMSQGPLPALMILNNEGILASWWIVYADSIRQGISFPGLAALGEAQPQQQPQGERQESPFANAGAQTPSSFGQTAFGKPEPEKPKATFGSSISRTASSAFASPGATLGGPSTFGQPAFGQPSFRSATPMGPTTQGTTFKMAGDMDARQSLWGTPSSGTAAAAGSVFGQPGLGGGNKSPFATTTTVSPFTSNVATSSQAPASSGFASFASKPSAFLTAAPTDNAEHLFGKSTPAASFGSGMDTDSSFMATPKKDEEAPKSSFGGGGGFTLGSTFKGDGTAANDAPKPSGNAPASLFGGGFGNMLEEVQKEPGTPQTKDADMDEEDDSAPAEVTKAPPTEDITTTPVAKPASPKFRFPSVPPATGGLFGTQAQSKTTPAAVQNSQPTSFGFGRPTPIPTPITTTPKDTPKRSSQSPLPSIETSPKVKTEPQSDEDDISPLNEAEAAPPEGYESPDTPTASKTPEPPLPPESTSKTTFAPGDSSNSSKSSDDAPLPPDFLPAKSKLKEVEPAPEEQPALPSGDEDQGSEEEEEEEEERGEEEDGEEEGYERSEEEGEERGSEEDRRPFDDEGSGVDVAQELSPTTDQSPRLTPGSSFGGPMEKSPPGGLFSRITRPQQGQKGKPLFGEVGKTSAPYLPPPSKLQQSPRSPSPVRSRALGDSLRPDNARSVSAPGPFKALDNRKAALSQLAVPSKPQPSAQDVRKQERERLAALQAQRAAEEEQDLSDREDERVREELATDVEPTKTLDPFLAHQDYIGDIDKPGIPGQIEKVYRDINSMIDTLGLNARSLKAFVKGHEQLYKQNGRERADLENDDWCLIEIAELENIESDVAAQLENGRIQDVPQKLNECRDLRRGVATLRARASDIARVIDAKSDPEKIETARSAPLRLDHAIQQQELRKKVTRFQKLLAEAEENITMLRAKLASCETGNGKGPPLKKPTVEAVTNTIMKMTSIVEKKCLDIDVLENQMRNLRFSSVASQNSREGSPFTPTSAKGKRVSRLGASALQNGHSYSPELSRSTRVSPRKAIEDFTPEEVQICREKAQRRQKVNDIIKEAFSKHGPRIRTLD